VCITCSCSAAACRQALEHAEGFTLEDAGPAPYPVPSFEALQHCHVTKVMHHLHLKLLEALNAATDESVVAALNGGSLLGVHDHSPVHAALLKCAALKVESSLHSLLLGSAAAYCKYMEGYEVRRPLPLLKPAVSCLGPTACIAARAVHEASTETGYACAVVHTGRVQP
jgi:hypothetical protein